MTKTYDIPEEVQAVDRMTATIAKLTQERDHLETRLVSTIAQRTDLLAALKEISDEWGKLERKPVPQGHPASGETYLSPASGMIHAELIEQARAAISRAEKGGEE